MDFKEILNAWEKQRAGNHKRQELEDLISRYPPKGAKDADRRLEEGKLPEPARGPANQRTVEPQATLDLHGMNSREAEQALDNFIHLARRRGLQRVLIVHGKGHHSPGEPVLLGVVRRYLEKCPYTGAFGPAGRKHGGRGATWVAVHGD
jgi:DNA-nicking Smr family endonuclease